MTGIDFPFELSEYEARLNKTRCAMEKVEIEVLIVVDPSNMGWLTGYDGWSFYVHQAVIITHDLLPLWWGRSMDGFATGLSKEDILDLAAFYSSQESSLQTPKAN